jgi:hypothetical protein
MRRCVVLILIVLELLLEHDEIRMSNDEIKTNDQVRAITRTWVLHLSFVIVNSSRLLWM